MSSEDRALLRQYFREKRNQLTTEVQRQHAIDCLNICLQSNVLQSTSNVACYLANDGELDPWDIIEFCWQQGTQVLLPVVDPERPGYLNFVKYRRDSSMQVNRFGIAEPIVTYDSICKLEKIDIIFAPLVAFDQYGNRLGMGGGFYDRTLAPIRQYNLGPRLIGLAHDCQQADKIPADGWDIPLQSIITPRQYLQVTTAIK
jgi:5-formyltetrahydrofolate cyclo-ligase